MKVSIQTIKNLFIGLGYPNAELWNDERMLRKFAMIREVTDGSEEIKDPEARDLFASVYNGHEIELAVNESETINITPPSKK